MARSISYQDLETGFSQRPICPEASLPVPRWAYLNQGFSVQGAHTQGSSKAIFVPESGNRGFLVSQGSVSVGTGFTCRRCSLLWANPEPYTLKHAGGGTRKVDVTLPGKGNSNSHGARPVHLIITMIKWIRTSRLSIKNSLALHLQVWSLRFRRKGFTHHLHPTHLYQHRSVFKAHRRLYH